MSPAIVIAAQGLERSEPLKFSNEIYKKAKRNLFQMNTNGHVKCFMRWAPVNENTPTSALSTENAGSIHERHRGPVLEICITLQANQVHFGLA